MLYRQLIAVPKCLAKFDWTRDAGVSISSDRTIPRAMYSAIIIPASIVLPNPTSSASNARPLSCLYHLYDAKFDSVATGDML